MKQLFAYILLFCLVFLNTPRNIYHNHVHANTETELPDSDKDCSINQVEDNCAFCAIDLFVAGPVEMPLKLAAQVKIANTSSSVLISLSNLAISHDHLRGPPVCYVA